MKKFTILVSILALALGMFATEVEIDTGTSTQRFPPNPAVLSSPADGAINVGISTTLNWTSGGGSPTGYKLFFGTNNPPTNIENNMDLGDMLAYNPGILSRGTTYYWRMVPYSAGGNATDCPVWSFSTVPEGMAAVGDGSVTNLNLPLNPAYNYNFSQTLYLRREINIPGQRIEKLYYHWNGLAEGTNCKNWTIYIGHTNKSAFASNSDWVPFGNLTQVFSDELILPASAGWIEITLTTPFVYNNTDNLVIAINEDTPGNAGPAAKFFGTSFAAYRSMYTWSSSSACNPALPGTGNRALGIANIRMQFGDLPTFPILSVYPETWDFGTQFINTVHPKLFSITNIGSGPFNISSLDITGTNFALAEAFTPVSLPVGGSTSFTVNFIPQTAGELTGSVVINDDRAVTNIPLSGICFDPMIYPIPWNEGFEENNTDNTAIYAWTQEGVVGNHEWAANNTAVSYNRSPRSGDWNACLLLNNTRWMFRPIQLEAGLIYRATVWARQNTAVAANATLGISYGTEASAAGMTQTILAPTGIFAGEYQRLEGTFIPATAGTYYLGILGMINGEPRYISIDDIKVELVGADDLAAIALTGNTTPSVGTAAQYTVRVLNHGTSPQSTYNVKLYDENDVELDSASGTVTIAPEATVDVVLSWIPTTEGLTNIYGKVFLDGDLDPENDATPPLSVTALQAGLLDVGIGNSNFTNNASGAPSPYGTYNKAFRQQLLYRATDLAAAGALPGMISALAFKVQGLDTCAPMSNYRIRLKQTDQVVLTTTFETGEYTTVWQRPSFMPNLDWNAHILDQPFFWDGTSSLIVEIVTDVMSGPRTNNALTYCSNAGYASSLRFSSDSANGGTGTTGNISVNRSNIRFFMIPPEGDPVFRVSPGLHDFGDVSLGGHRSRNFTIINVGAGTLEINTISIDGSSTMIISNLPTLPVALESGETAIFTVTFTPESLDTSTATVTITDELDSRHVIGSRDTHTVPLTGTGVEDITIGEGNQTARVPLDFFYKSTLFETIYTTDEMNNFEGVITGVKFYNQFNASVMDTPVKIWLGSTTQTSLQGGWIPSTQLTQVFDDTVNFPSGYNIITINFPEYYVHVDGENLVMMVNRPLDVESYAYSNFFKAQTVGSSRSRKIYSDNVEYDHAAPTGGTLNGEFPKTTFIGVPGCLGHITGTVLDTGGSPLADVQVNVATRTFATVTDAQGQFTIPNLLSDNYAVTFSRHGYVTQTINIVVSEDETEVMNVSMNLMPQVSVFGTILASNTGSGIAGVNISLVGFENYSGSTIGNGSFTFPAVFANHTYVYTISAAGYTSTNGTIDVGAVNYSMGEIVLNEIAYSPSFVEAEINAAFNAVNLDWNAPDPNVIEITEGFEADTFPPAAWSQIITNTGQANPQGVLPTWCSFGTINVTYIGNIAPTEGARQAGLWWDYAHQDEWLLTPYFNCPSAAYLTFDTYVTLGSLNDEHYCVKISSDGGNTWTILWDATAAAAGENHYAHPITIDLAAYGGTEVKLAFHAEDPPANNGLWYTWFIDNLYIGNATSTIRFAGSELTSAKMLNNSPNAGSGNTPDRLARAEGLRNSGSAQSSQISPVRSTTRTLEGYKIWRLNVGQENNDSSWISLNDEIVLSPHYEDQAWATIPNGNYKWAVRAVYTAGVMSTPALSNSLIKEVLSGSIVGLVRRVNGQGIVGATITTGGGYSATTNNAGAYLLNVPVGTYSVTATAAGFDSLTQAGVTVESNQNTTINFTMTPASNDDEIVPIAVTALRGNYPNPFNPETTISYDLKEAASVRLNIYNVKGQLVRSLVSQDQASGRYRVVFNACDDKGNPLASGLYLYRFTAGSYNSTRKMMLME